MNYTDKDGHLSDNGFALYADAIKFNKLAQLPGELTKHLETCQQCQHQLVDFSAIMMEVDQGAAIQHPFFDQPQKAITANKGGKIRSLWMRVAIAAVLALLLFFGYRQFSQPATPGMVKNTPNKVIDPKGNNTPIEIKEENQGIAEENKTTEKENESNQTISPKEESTPIDNQEAIQNNRQLFAANYEVNEGFESLLGTTVRSEGFEIKGPANNASYKKGSTIIFEWGDNIKLKLSIWDNEEELGFEAMVKGTFLEVKHELSPGVYYWKLETEEDLLHLGKLFIE